MAAKKKLDLTDVQTERVYNSAVRATGQTGQQDTASPEEAETRRRKLKTQGRKGCKAIRINMAFSPQNHRFIKVYASSMGMTMTEACNELLDYARTDPKFIARARRQLDSLMNTLEDDAAEDGAALEEAENTLTR